MISVTVGSVESVTLDMKLDQWTRAHTQRGKKRAFSKQPPFDPQKQSRLSLDDLERAMGDDDDMVPSPSPPREDSDNETEALDTCRTAS